MAGLQEIGSISIRRMRMRAACSGFCFENLFIHTRDEMGHVRSTQARLGHYNKCSFKKTCLTNPVPTMRQALGHMFVLRENRPSLESNLIMP